MCGINGVWETKSLCGFSCDPFVNITLWNLQKGDAGDMQ